MPAMFEPLRRFADFTGRSRRSAFWLFYLFVLVGMWLATWADVVLGLGGSIQRYWMTSGWSYYAGTQAQGGWLTLLFALAMLIPSLAVAVRRLHDGNRSGWWLLLSFVPMLGWLVLLFFYVQPSWPIDNRWGAPAA